MISLLFGAGASFGSELSENVPPLGNNLFDKLVEIGGAFFELQEDIKKEFQANGFEKGMLSIPNDSRVINPLQKEMAKYLSSFKPSNENAYLRLFRSLREYTRHVNIITLNYDLLIEYAMFMSGAQKVSYGIDRNKRDYSVLKLHGSANFIPIYPSDIIIENHIAVGCGSFVETNQIGFLSNYEEIVKWCDSPQSACLSPIMCMYNKEKRAVINSKYLESKRADYLEIISKTKKLIVVGVKFIEHDNHIWDVILDSVPEVIIVDPYPSEELLIRLSEKNIVHTVIKESFYKSVLKLSRHIRSSLNHERTI
ncbi:SIR2 family protein [Enterobacter roggenkampii]|uniref:hypothetical protein n=1 Tax=Enterobacter roggenkampii TaxID=1812935 RepID=UPI003890F4AB